MELSVGGLVKRGEMRKEKKIGKGKPLLGRGWLANVGGAVG